MSIDTAHSSPSLFDLYFLHALSTSRYFQLSLRCRQHLILGDISPGFPWSLLETGQDIFPCLSGLVDIFSPCQAKCRFGQVSFSQVNFEDGFRLKIVIILNVSNIKSQFHMWHLNWGYLAENVGVLESDNGNVISKQKHFSIPTHPIKILISEYVLWF